jgi:hypothetical protein
MGDVATEPQTVTTIKVDSSLCQRLRIALLPVRTVRPDKEGLKSRPYRLTIVLYAEPRRPQLEDSQRRLLAKRTTAAACQDVTMHQLLTKLLDANEIHRSVVATFPDNLGILKCPEKVPKCL